MQDQDQWSFRLSWIESFEFGQEFKELMPERSTKIAPLFGINFKNSLSFELDLISFCLSLLAVINNNNNFSNNNLNKDLTFCLSVETSLIKDRQTDRYQTSQQSHT